MLKISDLIFASKANLINGSLDITIQNYCIDSREIKENDFFIPIVGEKIDSHKFLTELVEKGIVGFFINANLQNKKEIIDKCINMNKNICILEVENTIKALYDIGKYNREKHIDTIVIAVTGSVGKTSTKEMISSIIETEYDILKTEKNYNGYIGLSLMLLKLDKQKIAVLEHGIDEIGEMKKLVEASKPNISVVTNIGTSHISKFGTQEVIFAEKMDVTSTLNKDSFIVLNGSDKYLKDYASNEFKVIKYDINSINNLNITNKISFETYIYNKKQTIEINEYGEHNIENSLCAIKVAEILKINYSNIINGIKNYKNFDRRFQRIELKENIILIDDTYNASIISMKSGLQTLKNINAKRKIVILGDMFELGENSKELHEELSKYIEKVDIAIFIGKDIKYTYDNLVNNEIKKYFFNSIEEAIEDIKTIIKSEDLIYLKASNGMKFNKIVKELIEYKEIK